MNNWIDKTIDITNILPKLPKPHRVLIAEIEEAEKTDDFFIYAQNCDDLEVWCKWLVPDVLTENEWDMICNKYSIPE